MFVLISQRVYAYYGHGHERYLGNEYDDDGGVEILLELAHLAGGIQAVELDLGLLSRIDNDPIGPVRVREEGTASGEVGGTVVYTCMRTWLDRTTTIAAASLPPEKNVL